MKNFGDYIKESFEDRFITIGGVKLIWHQDGMDFELGKLYSEDSFGLSYEHQRHYKKLTQEEVDSISEALDNGGFKYTFCCGPSSENYYSLKIEFMDHSKIVMQYVEVMSQGLDI
jgi:hypothetical protein